VLDSLFDSTCFLSDIENDPTQGLINRARHITDANQQLHRALLHRLQHLTDLVERTQDEIQMIRNAIRTLISANENQPLVKVRRLTEVDHHKIKLK